MAANGAKRAVALSAFIIALDQATKATVVALIPLGASREIIADFFNLTHLINTGAAWGMLRGQNLTLAILSAVTVAAIVLARQTLAPHRGQATALALVNGGIIGNLIDRVHHRAVVDFLDFHARDWHWPSFNVADSAICIGVMIYIIASVRADRVQPTRIPNASLPSPHEIKKL